MNSVLDIIYKQVIKCPHAPALHYLANDVYIPMTFQTMAQNAQQFSGYLSQQCGPGSRVIIWATNSWKWAIADLACQLSGMISVPVYPTIGPDQLSYILSDSQPELCCVDELTSDRLAAISITQSLKKIVVFNGCSLPTPGDLVVDFEAVLPAAETPSPLNHEAWGMSRLNNLLTILYTSGTTGPPKAVPLTHNNIVQNFVGLSEIIPITSADSSLSFLPLSHIFERTVGFYCVLGVGASIYYAESIETVSRDLIAARPTFLISVPRLYEKIHQKVMAARGIKKLILRSALAVASRIRSSSIVWRLLYRVVFSKIHQKTGGNVRFLVSGGAPLSEHVERFFNAIGLPIIQGYGLTETSPIISANLHQVVGSVGKVLGNLTVQILQDGEVCVKGPSVFSGYQNLSNDDVFTADGFFKTGDTGRLDGNGYLYITGRKKELIVLSNGKNVAPNVVEDVLSQSLYVHQIVVVGNNHNYLVALVVPNFEVVCHAVGSHKSPHDLVKNPQVKQLILNDLRRLSGRLAPFETIKKVGLIANEWSIEGTELTPTLKLRRQQINKKYHHLIESLYDT